MNASPIRIYFDGLCPLCSREVRFYRRLAEPGTICWVDLAAQPDAAAGAGFALRDALEQLHAHDADGALRTGLDAHLLMWSRLPGLRRLAAWLQPRPRWRRGIDAFYRRFTQWRPGQQRRRARGDSA